MTRNAIELVEAGFEDSEFLYPFYRLKEAGFDVTVAGSQEGQTYTGKHGVPVTADAAAADLSMNDVDVLMIPGGQAPDRMRRNPYMVRLVREALDQGKVVAAVCHGPQLLIEADVLDGRNLTCYASVKTDVVNAGGQYSDEEVVVDETLVTSRSPADLPAFMRETIRVAGVKTAPTATAR